jgi:two-component system, OmpR family, response regulator
MNLLLVEDDARIGDGLSTTLGRAGYAVEWVRDGYAAETALGTASYDLAILDVQLPRRSGLDVLRRLRRRGNSMPVLMLTARDRIADRVLGLDSGADDYMIKPFDLDELCARLRALERRAGGRTVPVLSYGALVLDPDSHTVTLAGAPVDLARREFSILQALLENAGRVLTRERLEQTVYGWGEEVGSNTVEVYVHHLRRKLGPDLIRTVRGVGYMLERRQ